MASPKDGPADVAIGKGKPSKKPQAQGLKKNIEVFLLITDNVWEEMKKQQEEKSEQEAYERALKVQQVRWNFFAAVINSHLRLTP